MYGDGFILVKVIFCYIFLDRVLLGMRRITFDYKGDMGCKKRWYKREEGWEEGDASPSSSSFIGWVAGKKMGLMGDHARK